MIYQRRDFLKTATTAAMSAGLFALPKPLQAGVGDRAISISSPNDDSRLKELVQTAIDAARTAGAQYADVRLTHTRERDITRLLNTPKVTDEEDMAIGVRTLVNGYWGFASSPFLSKEEMVRLAKSATAMSKANALGKPRIVELAPVPPVRDGSWTTPITIDPFDVHPMEFFDYLKDMSDSSARIAKVSVTQSLATFQKQHRIFGSSEGSYCSQRLYRSNGLLDIIISDEKGGTIGLSVDFLTSAGIGMELYWGRDIMEEFRRMREEGLREMALPVMPIDVGRYDIVFDGASMGTLTGATIGPAVEIDRALGYEANGVGTSYLNDPLEMLGQLQIAAPGVSISANRNEPGGASTVRWDDEGVETTAFPLVTNGVLTDFQAMREGGGWLKDSDVRMQRTMRARGCASCSSAINAPVTGAANLVMAPGQEALDLNGLVAGVDSGLLIRNANVQVDFQCLNGVLTGSTYEIKRGKPVARIQGAGILFRAPEIWKSITAIGGDVSLQRRAQSIDKGEPVQSLVYSVTAPAAMVKNATVIDIRRKA